MKPLNVEELQLRPFQILDQEWALLVSGKTKPNPMTVSWGGFGTLWHKPVVTIYVRPVRYTYDLLNESKEFTLNFLEKEHRAALDLCGTKSGREIDKWAATGLHPLKSEAIAVPMVAEARLAMECRVLAYQDFDPKRFVDPDVDGNYPEKDYHRIYWGEIVGLWIA